MNITTKWITFGLAGVLVLGLAAWSWAGPGSMQSGSMQLAQGASMGAASPSAGYGWHGMGRGGMGMMGRRNAGFFEGVGQWCAQTWGQMQGWMTQMMGGMWGSPNASAPATAPLQAQGTRVKIANFAYGPAQLRVHVGDTVTWTNQDTVGHNVVFDHGGVSAPLLAQGQSWTYTFTQEGTYSYYCGPHPFMKGTVVVER